MKPLTLTLALADDGTIGNKGAIPWSIPEDLRHFRAATLGHAVIMGRRTHESIGRPLPKRRNIVVSRNPDYRAEGCEAAPSLEDALRRARETDPEPCVIGGAGLYMEALPLATRVLLTRVHASPGGDTRLVLDLSAFVLVDRRSLDGEPRAEIETLERDVWRSWM